MIMSPTGDDLGDITMTPSRAMPLPTTLTQKSPPTPDGAASDSEPGPAGQAGPT